MRVKKCYSCRLEQLESNYYKSSEKKDGLQNECKACNTSRKKSWHQTDSGKASSANTKLKRRYGITLSEYESMVLEVGSKCEICGDTKSYLNHKLCIDHDHNTGNIRGVLCKACNLAVGNLKDSPELALKTFEYLNKGVNHARKSPKYGKDSPNYEG
jgi:hypothetical protein